MDGIPLDLVGSDWRFLMTLFTEDEYKKRKGLAEDHRLGKDKFRFLVNKYQFYIVLNMTLIW